MKDTWASGALELLRHSELHIQANSAFDKRIAFISIDNCVETAIRTFLSLPSSKSGVKIPRKEVEDVANSFPKLVSLVFKHAPQKVAGLDESDIEHYHRIRNQLYHDGTGLSVDERYLSAYRLIACVLLNNLFDVSLKTENVQTPSLERLILLWNELESEVRHKLDMAKIRMPHPYKWNQVAKTGIIDMQTLKDIDKLRMIRNRQVHSTPDQLDRNLIKKGVVLGEKILKQIQKQNIISVPVIPKLTSEAHLLIVEAAKGSAGQVLKLAEFGGTVIQTNGRNFVERGNPRSSALWEAAVNELVNFGLLEPSGNKGEVFSITHAGYQVADTLKKTTG
jgi:hypothetical protein